MLGSASHAHGGSCRVTDGHLCLGRILSRIGVFFLVLLVLSGRRTADLLLRTGLFDHPVEDEVVFVSHPVKEVFEEFAQVTDVRLLFELETATVVQVNSELVRQILCQHLDGRGQLLVPNFFILLLLSSGGKSLPRKAAFVEVHEDEAERLKIISTGLLDSQVGVDGGIAGCSRQIFAITVRDVLTRLRVAEALGEAEVDDIDVVLLLSNADQEVVWLDVTMQKVARVDEFNSLQLNQRQNS